MEHSRGELVYMAKLCEQTERFSDMLEYIRKLLKKDNQRLSVDERNLLSVAYKNEVGSRRTAWRVLCSIETKDESKKDAQPKLLSMQKAQIENELYAICNEIIEFLETRLIPGDKTGDAKTVATEQVFYLKMKGDYCRYISECKGEKNQKYAEQARESYLKAMDIATKNLAPTDPIRLGLALNFSVFYYEVENNPKLACELAKSSFDAAVSEVDSLEEESYKDSTTIMQLIRDNLTLWTSELGEKDGNDTQNPEP